MKVTKTGKKKRFDLGVDDEDSRSSPYKEPGVAKWAETDSSRFKKLSKQAKVLGQRAPEFWVRDGESRLTRFVDDDAIVSFEAYRFKHNGRWSRFTRPRPGKPDLFASKLGLKPSRCFVFRLIDIDGYKDRQGKQHTNLARFFVVSNRLYDQIQLVVQETGEDLNEFNIKISRTGQGRDTSYMLFAKQASPLTPQMKKVIANFPKWEDVYKPMTTDQQQAIIMNVSGNGDEDSENNPY
jgi:hypothetical protein